MARLKNQPTQPTHRQPNRALNESSKTQKAKTISANTSSKEKNDTPNMGLSPDKIMESLKNHTPVGDTLITKLKEPPLFLFCSIPGRHKVINVFCDTGNSHCLFTNGTPENLYVIRTNHWEPHYEKYGTISYPYENHIFPQVFLT